MAMTGDGILLFGTEDGYMHALSAASGGEMWKYHAGSAVGPPTVGHDGTVYFAGDSWGIAADSQNGHIKWREYWFNFSLVPIVMDNWDNLIYIRGAGHLDVWDFHGHFMWEAADDQGALQLMENIPPVLYHD